MSFQTPRPVLKKNISRYNIVLRAYLRDDKLNVHLFGVCRRREFRFRFKFRKVGRAANKIILGVTQPLARTLSIRHSRRKI